MSTSTISPEQIEAGRARMRVGKFKRIEITQTVGGGRRTRAAWVVADEIIREAEEAGEIVKVAEGTWYPSGQRHTEARWNLRDQVVTDEQIEIAKSHIGVGFFTRESFVEALENAGVVRDRSTHLAYTSIYQAALNLIQLMSVNEIEKTPDGRFWSRIHDPKKAS